MPVYTVTINSALHCLAIRWLSDYAAAIKVSTPDGSG